MATGADARNEGGGGGVQPLQYEAGDATMLPREPLVSVLMIVYRHAEYLREAIDSIVGQRAPFPYELIIGEDASPDESLSIALEYQRKYPHLIRVIHADRNVGMNANSRRVRAAARGKYLAWCEGDDYWCAADKLARQVELIESDPRVGAVHSDWVRSHRRNGRWIVSWHRSAHAHVRPQLLSGELLHAFHHPGILRTCTLLFRKEIARECDASVFGRKNYPFGDTVTALFITSRWHVAYLPEVTAVYRMSENSALRSGVAARLQFLATALEFDEEARIHATGQPYPDSYRIEVAAGLFLWALRAGSLKHARQALSCALQFGIRRSIRGALQAAHLRLPSFRNRSRIPADRGR